MDSENQKDGTDAYTRLSRPPQSALKQIQAGRLKGKTDINPQWRYKAMNDEYGACGNGWKYTIDKLWTEHGSDGQIFAFSMVSVYVRGKITTETGARINSIGWSDAIPGIGGSMLIAKESSGLHNNDEAFKMATTDALSVALKQLGVAADIYAGFWDGTKYKEQAKPESSKTVGKSDYDKLTEAQKRKVDGVADEIIKAYSASDEIHDVYKIWLEFKSNGPLIEEVTAASDLLPSYIRTEFKKIAKEQKEQGEVK